MPKQSAGLLLWRKMSDVVEVLLVHPGGPYWAKKDVAAWSIPKGELDGDEDGLSAAKREFAEEMGGEAPEGEYIQLEPVNQSANKTVHAWALQHDFDTSSQHSNLITIDWPPKSGKTLEIPEVDRAEWFELPKASLKIVEGQAPLLDQLVKLLSLDVLAPLPPLELEVPGDQDSQAQPAPAPKPTKPLPARAKSKKKPISHTQISLF